MQNIVWKVVLILAVLALCLFSVYPPGEKIRLGKDLRGGTSLVYLVSMPPDTPNKADVLNQTITVLKERVNPSGVLDIAMSPLGLDRIEIVMPLPSDEIKALRKAYDDALEALKGAGQISEDQVDEALRLNRAAEELAGTAIDPDRIKALQDAYNALQEARAALAAARANPPATQPTTAPSTQPADASVQPPAPADPQQAIYQLEDRVVTSQERFEALRTEILSQNLEQARVIRAITASTERRETRDATGRPILDDQGKPQFEPSQRETAINALKAQFPQAATKIDAAVAAYDEYQSKRTTLDDPEDLMRLLRGAGVLDFRIVVSNGSPEGVNIQDLRRQLAEVGPANTDSAVAAWFPVFSLKEFGADTPEMEAQAEADPEAFFAARGLVGARHDGKIYMLLYTAPTKSMSHSATSQWSVERVYPSSDQLGRAAVAFSLDAAGGALMLRMTGAHVNQRMAIVLDGQVYSAPNLESQIGKSGIIQGQFSPEDINYLIRVLAAGSLSARLSDQPISINTIGPSLGRDNLERGKTAFILSLIVTASIMLVYYFFAGFIANVALLINAIMIFGTMALIQGTFTLPGIAGMALAVAMAVDANVLIYERIREELINNKEDLRTAIRLGYSRAMNAIIDGNVAHLITCVVLMYTATTEVKGFALTMILGVVATLFTALFVTRVLYTFYTEYFGVKTLPMLPTVFPGIHKALEPHVNWISKRYVFYAVSAAVSLISLALVFSVGSRLLDTEFRGGMSMTLQARAARGDEPRDREGNLLLKRPNVERRVHALGERAGEGNPALWELRNASIVTVGESGPEFAASRFQVKVTNPPGSPGEATITDQVQSAIVEEFRNDLEVTPSLRFDGSEQLASDAFAHAEHTYPIEDPSLGANIGMPQFTQSVKNALGGVALVLKNVDPPVTAEAAASRIRSLRQAPDFSALSGREFMVYGLEPAEAGNAEAGFRSLAVVTADASLDQRKVDFELWDSQLAAPEWKLAVTALARGSSLQDVSSFSPAIASTLAANAVVAVVLSLLGMLVYIWARFGSLRYSMATIVAVTHNVIVCLGALALTHYIARYAFAQRLGLDEYRIDLNVIAALLTIIGYSLNDTIVILDRIRENRGKRLFATASIINASVNQTFSRTILTGGSTILASIILFVLGGTGIQPFAYTFLVGLIVGTISSVTIAAPLVYKSDVPDTQAPPLKTAPAQGLTRQPSHVAS